MENIKIVIFYVGEPLSAMPVARSVRAAAEKFQSENRKAPQQNFQSLFFLFFLLRRSSPRSKLCFERLLISWLFHFSPSDCVNNSHPVFVAFLFQFITYLRLSNDPRVFFYFCRLLNCPICELSTRAPPVWLSINSRKIIIKTTTKFILRRSTLKIEFYGIFYIFFLESL